MIKRTLGAPLGGTTRGGHQAFDSEAFSLITPPNFGSGGGSCFPLMVVVALGEPNSPVTCCAMAGMIANMTAATTSRIVTKVVFIRIKFLLSLYSMINENLHESLRNN